MKTMICTCAVLVATTLLAVSGCRHTAEGVKDDTKNAVHKTGEGLEKAGEKLQGVGGSDDHK